MLLFPYSKIQALVTILNQPKMECDVTMATQQCYMNNPNPLFSKAHLTAFKLNNFKMVEAM
jgi:hypothetical protein